MKKLFLFLVAFIFLFSCGQKNNNTEKLFWFLFFNQKNSPIHLNIQNGNSAFIQNNGNLAQIVHSNNSNKSLNFTVALQGTNPPDTGIIEVTDDQGRKVTIEEGLQINDKYIILRGVLVPEDPKSEKENFILDVGTGNCILLSLWPDQLNRVISDDSNAYFISGGTIYSLDLLTAHFQIISNQGAYWDYTLKDGYIQIPTNSWIQNSWLFLNDKKQLYAIAETQISEGHPVGMAGRFSFSDGTWKEDIEFNKTFFKSMPSYFFDQIPGQSLIMTQWFLTDQKNFKLYHILFNNNIISVYNYDLDNWQDKDLTKQKTISNNISSSTFLGFNNSLNYSILTDGKIILKFFNDIDGKINFIDISVPVDIPISSTLTLNAGYNSNFGPGAVTNWSYLNNYLYFMDIDRKIYQWDMISPYQKSDSISTVDNLNFLY